MRGEFVFSGGEVERVMVRATAALETLPGFPFIGNKPIETRAQKGLKAGLRGVVVSKMILLEGVGEESLSQIFCVLVACLPFEANIFVDWFPVTVENGF